MKILIELPDALLREAEAAAGRREESLDDLFEGALRRYLTMLNALKGDEPWRKFVGKAPKGATEGVDAIIADEIRQVEWENWR